MLTKPRAFVLIVDDDASRRRLVRGGLEDDGFAVMEASNGRAALDMLVGIEAVEPRLILLDVEMPVMNGWELLAILKSYRRLARIPVVMLSETLDVDGVRARVLERIGSET